jgi:hypothetical protein
VFSPSAAAPAERTDTQRASSTSVLPAERP